MRGAGGETSSNGAVRRMRTRIRLLAQPEPMRSMVLSDDTVALYCSRWPYYIVAATVTVNSDPIDE